MSDFSDIEFVTNGSEVFKESKFKPKFYIVFLIVFSIYYFFSPILSHFIFSILENYVKLNNTNFLYYLVEKFLIPNLSIFIILLLYILLVEERKVSFLFSINKNFSKSIFKGFIFSVVFIFALIFIFVLRDYSISFKLNRVFSFFNLLQLILIIFFMYIKLLFLECLYRGWLFNILSSRYSLIISILLTSIVPTVIKFIEYQRIGIYLIFAFLFNILLILIFLVYKNIFITTSFVCFYEFLKKYIFSLENMDFNLKPVFYTVINNMEVFNIENSFYSLFVLIFSIIVFCTFYKYKLK